MAILTFTIDIQGGDYVTPNADLTYKIYGGIDGYVTPIVTTGSANSDPNVSILGDTVTIVDADVGAEDFLKTTQTDEEGNESLQSIKFTTGEWKVRFDPAFGRKIQRASNLIMVGDFEVEGLIARWVDATGYLWCAADSTMNTIWQTNQTLAAKVDGISQSSPLISNLPLGLNVDTLIKFKRVSGVLSVYVNNVLEYTYTSDMSGDFRWRQIGTWSTSVYGSSDWHWFKITANGNPTETFDLQEGEGNKTYGDLGTELTLNFTGGTADDFWIRTN